VGKGGLFCCKEILEGRSRKEREGERKVEREVIY
jgi:hypothetical protein